MLVPIRSTERGRALASTAIVMGGLMKGAKLVVIVRCLVTFTIGFLFVVLAIRFGELLWRAFER